MDVAAVYQIIHAPSRYSTSHPISQFVKLRDPLKAINSIARRRGTKTLSSLLAFESPILKLDVALFLNGF